MAGRATRFHADQALLQRVEERIDLCSPQRLANGGRPGCIDSNRFLNPDTGRRSESHPAQLLMRMLVGGADKDVLAPFDRQQSWQVGNLENKRPVGRLRLSSH
ncbi:MAG: hypothetical protein K2Y56_25860 [Methylobacterium sp.]|nr:hypothetical protein [Methylobacterium sp.]